VEDSGSAVERLMVSALRKTRVLVVDDSATSRRMLSGSLRGEPDIEVVAEASDAFAANKLIAQHRPDVITLDIEMPQMDGLAFLRHLMKHQPIPVIIVSSHTPTGSALSLEALRAGAVEVIPKPADPRSVVALASRLKARIRQLRVSQVHPRPTPRAHATAAAAHLKISQPVSGLIAIGASTGGPQALESLLTQLPADTPPILIVQHMPAPFIRLFADRLNDVCPMRVVMATDGEPLAAGVAHVAPAGHHLIVEQQGGRLRTGLRRGPPVGHQRPAVDVLFHSLARLRRIPIVGVLLTGMGRDGADGMVALRRAGQETIAEDESSCVVFGMPREAIARGGAVHVVALNRMAATIVKCLDRAPKLR
jgi:two-component system chemotaxis response regulator CheB